MGRLPFLSFETQAVNRFGGGQQRPFVTIPLCSRAGRTWRKRKSSFSQPTAERRQHIAAHIKGQKSPHYVGFFPYLPEVPHLQSRQWSRSSPESPELSTLSTTLPRKKMVGESVLVFLKSPVTSRSLQVPGPKVRLQPRAVLLNTYSGTNTPQRACMV